LASLLAQRSLSAFLSVAVAAARQTVAVPVVLAVSCRANWPCLSQILTLLLSVLVAVQGQTALLERTVGTPFSLD
jgi:hypothetical protein